MNFIIAATTIIIYLSEMFLIHQFAFLHLNFRINKLTFFTVKTFKILIIFSSDCRSNPIEPSNHRRVCASGAGNFHNGAQADLPQVRGEDRPGRGNQENCRPTGGNL